MASLLFSCFFTQGLSGIRKLTMYVIPCYTMYSRICLSVVFKQLVCLKTRGMIQVVGIYVYVRFHTRLKLGKTNARRTKVNLSEEI